MNWPLALVLVAVMLMAAGWFFFRLLGRETKREVFGIISSAFGWMLVMMLVFGVALSVLWFLATGKPLSG